jgi:hypothetical protein
MPARPNPKEGVAPQQDALAEPRRRDIFRMLISARDMQLGVPESYELIRHRFGVADSEIRRIEREGLDGDWPPL